jgi:hypothetical protein
MTTGLPAAVQEVLIAADPALSADRVGLNFADLGERDRSVLAEAHRQAIAGGIERIEDAARDGDKLAERWLAERGLG